MQGGSCQWEMPPVPIATSPSAASVPSIVHFLLSSCPVLWAITLVQKPKVGRGANSGCTSVHWPVQASHEASFKEIAPPPDGREAKPRGKGTPAGPAGNGGHCFPVWHLSLHLSSSISILLFLWQHPHPHLPRVEGSQGPGVTSACAPSLLCCLRPTRPPQPGSGVIVGLPSRAGYSDPLLFLGASAGLGPSWPRRPTRNTAPRPAPVGCSGPGLASQT